MSDNSESRHRRLLAKKLARALDDEILNEFQLSQLTAGSADEATVKELQDKAVQTALKEVPFSALYLALVSAGIIPAVDTSTADKEAWLDAQATILVEAEASEDEDELELAKHDFTSTLAKAGRLPNQKLYASTGSTSSTSANYDSESGLTHFEGKAGTIGSVADVRPEHMAMFEAAIRQIHGHKGRNNKDRTGVGFTCWTILAARQFMPVAAGMQYAYSANVVAALVRHFCTTAQGHTDRTVATHVSRGKAEVELITSEIANLPEFQPHRSRVAIVGEPKTTAAEPQVQQPKAGRHVGSTTKPTGVTKFTQTSKTSEGIVTTQSQFIQDRLGRK